MKNLSTFYFFNKSVNKIGTHAMLNLHYNLKLFIMSKISSTDNLFISATSMGQQFYNFMGSGMASLEEIMNTIRNAPNAPRGMVMYTVRNASQGWSQSRAFYNI